MADQTIGKYRILEQIGRGGMGIIFKAHDPVLDRLVALKVISPEVDVTDERRARFFREAQACAKLNHPNIVTVYDLGEDNGRLFIVMELLEGQELRRLISPGTPLTLEDKLSVMVQVCGGLHYAHQKGIVHRDMKPGNVFLLVTGRVKILDFGIAHMASTEHGLTRTGLIMGTLRYISPEQVQGRADHRSDMFSIGSVFYELLTLRPPFTGEDPMHVLEQLRTEDPPPPSEIDATVPPALAAIVQRAMRKNPAERFRDLEEMRVALEQVQRAVIEERSRVSARVRDQQERLVRLQGQLAERLGTPGDHADIPPVDGREGLVAIQALERTLAVRIGEIEGKIAETEPMEPAMQRADGLLEAGRFEEAVAQFEAIVAHAPEHRRGRAGLDRARAAADAQKRGRRGTELAEKARAALREGRYAVCLEILKQAAELAPPAEIADELTSLRDRALAEQEALRRQRQETESASKQSEAARVAAQAEDAPQYAPEPWNEAQAMMATAEANLRHSAYAEAKAAFERAAAAYRRAQAAAGQARVEERRAAEQAREAAAQEQQQAGAADAAQYARDLWQVAEAKFGEGQAAFARPAAGWGRVEFVEASALYRKAEETAREARARERQRAEAARERAAEGRRSAAALDAERRAPSLWQDANAKSAAGEAAWVRQQFARATDAFEAALGLYHRAQGHLRELARRQREEGGRKQQQVVEGRRRAEAADAAVHAAAEWAEAEASAGAAAAALEGDAWEEASAGLDRTVALYRLAEERAREVRHERLQVEKAGEHAEAARRGAVEAQAGRFAPEPWRAAETAEAQAVAAFSRQRYTAARELFGEAGRLYAAAQHAAGLAAEAETRRDITSSPLEATEPTERPSVVAPTMTFVGTTGPSPAAPRIEDPAPARIPTPEADAWEAPEPSRGRPLAIVAGLMGLAAIIVVATVYWKSPGPRPLLTPGDQEIVAAGGTEAAKATDESSPGRSGERDKTARVGADPLAVTDKELPPRPGRGPTRTVGDAKTDGPPRRQPVETTRTEPPRPASETRQDVTKLAGRVAAARLAAERAAAGYWVPQSWMSARAKEQLAATALGRSDYEEAVKLLREAESEYQVAAERARTEADAEGKIAPLKERVRESRASTGAQRAAAVAAQAARLAKDAFEAAEATHRQADDLDRRGDFAGAAKAYEAAAAQYREGERRARAARESRPSGEGTRGP